MGVKLLGKIKIHEIAKKLGLTSKEIIDRYYKEEPYHNFYIGEIKQVNEK